MDDFYNNQNNQYNQGDQYNQNSEGAFASYSFSAAPPPPQKKKHSTGVVILSALLAAIIGASAGILGAISYVQFNKGGESSSVSEKSAESGEASKAQNVTINVDKSAVNAAEAVSEKAGKSVVGIRTTTSVISFFGGSQKSTGEGSGVVYTSDGYIITNYHVIEDAVKSTSDSTIEVFVGSVDSTPYQATVVGYNISSDLAVLKIEAQDLDTVEIADSSDLKAGQSAVAIGAPGGLEFMGSVTYGVISGLDRVRSASSSVALIQTDAAINPGNSGGALFDVTGKLIGINSSKIVADEYENMGFVIPSNTVVGVVNKIISKQNEPDRLVGNRDA